MPVASRTGSTSKIYLSNCVLLTTYQNFILQHINSRYKSIKVIENILFYTNMSLKLTVINNDLESKITFTPGHAILVKFYVPFNWNQKRKKILKQILRKDTTCGNEEWRNKNAKNSPHKHHILHTSYAMLHVVTGAFQSRKVICFDFN